MTNLILRESLDIKNLLNPRIYNWENLNPSKGVKL